MCVCEVNWGEGVNTHAGRLHNKTAYSLVINMKQELLVCWNTLHNSFSSLSQHSISLQHLDFPAQCFMEFKLKLPHHRYSDLLNVFETSMFCISTSKINQWKLYWKIHISVSFVTFHRRQKVIQQWLIVLRNTDHIF